MDSPRKEETVRDAPEFYFYEKGKGYYARRIRRQQELQKIEESKKKN